MNEISNILGKSRANNCEDSNIQYLLTDSRNLIYPEKSLFFALRSQTGDGHAYIDDLLAQGVKNFVVDHFCDAWETADANFWVVENTLTALQQIALHHRQQFQLPVVGITGSNGKTIVKEWLYTLLQNGHNCVRSPKSYNSQIGVPLSVWQLQATHEIGIFEAGISTTGEMQRIANIIAPTLGIFTNLGSAHQAGFASNEEKLCEKLQLFTTCQTLVYRYNPHYQTLIEQQLPNVQLLSWGINEPSAVIPVSIEAQTTNHTKIWLQYQGEGYSYTLPFADAASIENAIHAILMCLVMGETNINTQLLEPISMRLSIKQGLNNCLLIDDAYTADLSGLQVALNVMDTQAKNKYDSKVVILSDLPHSSGDEQALYTAVSSLLQEKKVTQLIGIGNVLPLYADVFPMPTTFYASTADFLATKPAFNNQLVLIKGARRYQMEQITAHLEQKRHETVMEVNLNALVNNFKHLRSFLAPTTKAVAMIKANAYGCGAISIAQTLQHHHCDYFGVAVADEGAELRKAGIKTPIMVMNPEASSFDVLLQYCLEPEIYSFEVLHRFIEFADKEGARNYPIHLKFDTGMHRLGFEQKDLPALIALLKQTSVVTVASAFSHLAAAEDPAMDAFTLQQIATFETCTKALQETLPYPFLRHILNTSGIQRFPMHQYDMVRMGIGLYGVGIDEASPIQHVATLKTVILQTKELPQGETVGYNRKGVLARNSKVAAIPIGYADGLDRAFGGGKGFALVRGQKAPFLGNICMDVCMIDVTDIDDVAVGDTVVIFGEELTINHLAQTTNTIPYEILTRVSARVKRIYYQE